MSYYSPSIEKLIESFEKLPSIGHKTAQRLAFYMLDLSDNEVNEFTGANQTIGTMIMKFDGEDECMKAISSINELVKII